MPPSADLSLKADLSAQAKTVKGNSTAIANRIFNISVQQLNVPVESNYAVTIKQLLAKSVKFYSHPIISFLDMDQHMAAGVVSETKLVYRVGPSWPGANFILFILRVCARLQHGVHGANTLHSRAVTLRQSPPSNISFGSFCVPM